MRGMEIGDVRTWMTHEQGARVRRARKHVDQVGPI